MTFLWVVVGVLSVLMVICLLALVDQYHTLELIRAKLKIEDNPQPLNVPRDRAPSGIGLPLELDGKPHLVVLFLSTSCNTCRSIAKGLNDSPSPNIWVVLEHAHTAERALQWLDAVALPADRVTIDLDGSVADALTIDVTPSAVVFREGRVLLAQTIPSFRQLTPLLSAGNMPPSLLPVKELAPVEEGTALR
ncbi:MAG TPA: hypothetical protein VF062_25265 [Candidatus Limnocylindrales bacterium]